MYTPLRVFHTHCMIRCYIHEALGTRFALFASCDLVIWNMVKAGTKPTLKCAGQAVSVAFLVLAVGANGAIYSGEQAAMLGNLSGRL